MLVNKYLKSTKWVKNARSQEDRQRFQTTVDLFKKYGKQYDLDLLGEGCAEQRLHQLFGDADGDQVAGDELTRLGLCDQLLQARDLSATELGLGPRKRYFAPCPLSVPGKPTSVTGRSHMSISAPAVAPAG